MSVERLEDALTEHSQRNGDAGVQLRLTGASAALGLHSSDPIVAVWRATEHGDAPMIARTAGGTELRWETQAAMLDPKHLVFPVLARSGLPGPAERLTAPAAQWIYKALVEAAETGQRLDARDETLDWLDGFEAAATPRQTDLTDPVRAFLAIDEMRVHHRFEGLAVPLLLDVSNGERYVRRGDFADYVRKGRRVQISWAGLNSRLLELGWAQHDLQAWEPEVPRAEARHVHVRTYRSRP